MAGPVGDEAQGPRTVLGGLATLDRRVLGEGGWTILTDLPDRLVVAAGGVHVRVVVDAVLEGTTTGGPGRGSLVAALNMSSLLEPARYVTRPTGVVVVMDPVDASMSAPPCGASRSTAAAYGCAAAALPRLGLTGDGDAHVVLGSLATERLYVVGRGSGNLVVEAQAATSADGWRTSLETADDLVRALTPAGARVKDDLSPLGYAGR